MTANTQAVVVKTGKSRLVRARFGPGMLLQHNDLEAMTAYTRDLSRLLFRSFFGCGVVCGLTVSVDEECGKTFIDVAPGLALDGCGDPIHVPETQHFALDENCNPDIPKTLWIVLCGTQKCCAPRNAMCASDDDEAAVCTREYDAFEIRVLREPPECACGCFRHLASRGEGEAHAIGHSFEGNEAFLANANANANADANANAAASANAAADRAAATDCQCVDPKARCYEDHYMAVCPSCCGNDGDSCDCRCVVLAYMRNFGPDPEHPLWCVSHGPRRLIRPLLMKDRRPPLDAADCKAKREKYPTATSLAQAHGKMAALRQQLNRLERDKEELVGRIVDYEALHGDLQRRFEEARAAADAAEARAREQARDRADAETRAKAEEEARIRAEDEAKAKAKARMEEERVKPRKDKPQR